MEDDNLSLLSDQDSIDPDRASLEAERQSLYGDTETSSEPYSNAMTPSSRPTIYSPKVQEATQGFFDRDAAQSSNSRNPEPMRDAGPAPPDYAAATGGYQAVRTYNTLSTSNSNYTPNTQWPRSGPEPTSEEQIGLITAYPVRRKPKKGCRGGCCGACCWFFFRFLSLTIGILLVLTIFGVFDQNKTHIMPPSDGQKLPIAGDYGGHGSDPHPPTSKCQYSSYSKPVQFDFEDIESFSLVEKLQRVDDFYGDINGYIWIVPAKRQTEAQTADIRVWTSIATTDPWSIKDSIYEKHDQSLEIKFPSLEKETPGGHSRACMNIAMVVMIKDDVTLQSLNISSVHLDVKVFENLTDIGLGLDKSHIDVTTGKVTLEYWSSRETRISTVSGHVQGLYALRDLLQITTVSGNIAASIDPKKADASHPAPARYIAKSTSGNIHTSFPTTGTIPARDYEVEIEGRSSTITGTYLFQSSIALNSISGTMDVDLTPYDSTAKNIRVETASGDQKITVSSPYKDPGKAVKGLQSYHGSISGTLKLKYPQEWEGVLEGDTMTGNVKLEGRELEQAEVDGGFFQDHFSARKGKGSSRIGIKTLSGDVWVRVGDV